jgi:hypothetical protein
MKNRSFDVPASEPSAVLGAVWASRPVAVNAINIILVKAATNYLPSELHALRGDWLQDKAVVQFVFLKLNSVTDFRSRDIKKV